MLPLISFLLVIAADRLSKAYFISRGEFELNPGIALSLFSDAALSGFLFNSLGLLLVLALLIYSRKEGGLKFLILSVIFAGGISNLLDRLIFSGVVDFVRIGPFPRFNFADLTITVGVLALLILSLRKDGRVKTSNN